jgi:hypothetical protein
MIRAGARITGAVQVAAKDLIGGDPLDERIFWSFTALNPNGDTVTARADYRVTGGDLYPPPFSFRPATVIPAPNGHLFCLSAPLGNYLITQSGLYWPGWFIDFFRVYHRNGDWISDFPALHGGRIFDLKIDGDGNIFVAGAEVGEDAYSFRKYNSSGVLQWSVSFEDYDRPLLPAYSMPNRQRYSTHIDIGDDGSLYVMGIWAFDLTSSSQQVVDRYFIAKVSAIGVISWVKFTFPIGLVPISAGLPTLRDLLSFKVLSDNIAIFFLGYIGYWLVVGKTSGYYGTSDFVQIISPYIPNGFVFSTDGDFIRCLWSPNSASNVFQHCVMRYANDHLYVNSVYIGSTYEYYRHVFYKDLSLISTTQKSAFDTTEAFAISENLDEYYGKRVKLGYEGTLGGSTRLIGCGMHFRAVDENGTALWSALAASGKPGVNQYGKPWRDYGLSRSNVPWTSVPVGSTQAEYQTFHDSLDYTQENGEIASGDLVAFDEFLTTPDFWLPATSITIGYNSPTPALALPVFLKTPNLIAPINSLPPALALRFNMRVPFLRREYTGPLLPQIYRLTLGDLDIPFSTLIVTKTAFEVTISAICPAASEPLVAAIIARDTDTLAVWRGVRFLDGTEQLELLLSGALAGFRYDRGTQSGSITLTVRQAPAAIPSRTRTLASISRMEGLSWISPLPDIFLNPGDTVNYGDKSFIALSVEYQINPIEARMIIKEPEN